MPTHRPLFQRRHLADRFDALFRDDNPQYDRTRFYLACWLSLPTGLPDVRCP